MVNWIIGIPLLTLFASVALATAVIPSTRREAGRFTLNLLLALIVLWTFCSVMFHSIAFPSSLFWIYLILLCGISTGVVGVHFSAQFAKQTGRIVHLVVRIFYLLTPVIFILVFLGKLVEEARLLPNGAVEVKFGTMAPLMWGMAGLATLVALAILTSAYIKSSHSERKHIIFPVLGFIVMCLGALSNTIISSYPVDIAANLIFISFITYGVVSSHIIRPAHMQPLRLTIPVIALMLALCYAAVVVFCLKWLGTTTGTSHLIAAITVIIFGSITFYPSRMFLSNKLAQFFFPNIYRYHKSLRDLSSVDNSLSRWANSVTNILNIITKATSADDAVLLLQNSKAKYFEAKYAVGRDPASVLHLRLPIDSPIVKALVERGAALSTGDLGREIISTAILLGKDNTLQEIGPTLYCGVQGHDGLLAIIALTRKSPHVWDQAEDRDFLELTSRQIAPIIENFLLYQVSQREITERKRTEEALRENERRYRLLAENAKDVIWTVDMNMRPTYMSPSITYLLGYSVEEAIAKPMEAVFTPASFEISMKTFSEELAVENMEQKDLSRSRTLELELIRKDGSIVPVEIRYTFIREPDGRPIAILAIVRDITERKLAEEKIKRAAEEWRTTFDSITDLVFICDKDFRLIRVNKAFADVFKKKPADLIGKPCYEIVHGINEPVHNCPHKKTTETKKPAAAEFFEPHLGMHLEMSTSPIFNEKGEVIASVHITRDITQRMKMEEQLIVTDRLASIGELSSGIAHELNNPLTSVIGFSDLLLGKKNLPDDVKEDLKVINREAKRTAGIVKNLLTFARKHPQEKQSVDVNKVIQGVLELRAYEQRLNKIEVNAHFAPDLPEITANGFELQQVFINIIINAEHFMIEKNGRGTLTITTERAGDIIRASFADDGPGIAKENLGHLFDPFFTIKEVGKGTGLGLSISYGIITEHGGRIYAESELGKGATFIVELPISQ